MICSPISCLRAPVSFCPSPCKQKHSPRLPRHFGPIIHVLLRFVERVEIQHALVAIILARPDLRTLARLLVGRVGQLGVVDDVGSVVDEDVAGRVPSTKVGRVSAHAEKWSQTTEEGGNSPTEAEIEPSHEANRLVHDTHLLVLQGARVTSQWRAPRRTDAERETTYVRPQQGARGRVRRRALHVDIGMQRAQRRLGIVGVDGTVRARESATRLVSDKRAQRLT